MHVIYLLENSAKQLRAKNGTILDHHHLKVTTCRKCQILIRYSPINKSKNGADILTCEISGLVLYILRHIV